MNYHGIHIIIIRYLLQLKPFWYNTTIEMLGTGCQSKAHTIKSAILSLDCICQLQGKFKQKLLQVKIMVVQFIVKQGTPVLESHREYSKFSNKINNPKRKRKRHGSIYHQMIFVIIFNAILRHILNLLNKHARTKNLMRQRKHGRQVNQTNMGPSIHS